LFRLFSKLCIYFTILFKIKQDVFLWGELYAVLEQAFGTRKYFKFPIRTVKLGVIEYSVCNMTKGSS